jgi:hypothetical protein
MNRHSPLIVCAIAIGAGLYITIQWYSGSVQAYFVVATAVMVAIDDWYHIYHVMKAGCWCIVNVTGYGMIRSDLGYRFHYRLLASTFPA